MPRFGYARVSSTDQDLTIQLDKLKSAGCSVIRSEKLSGKSVEDRPELATLMQFSAFLSACGLAGGAPGQRDSGTTTDEQARTGFWRWYLEEAVPMAYAEAVRRRVKQGCR